ncbi:hypothetical protein LTR91_004573 [Friedmanniomyces endolithicus]|uniref:Cation efflux protein cytoplasmic domain-containing protein n=1 Tax=Friedmanniomyces endolithicus TaxID=329885 RepID=A0AAN6KUS7_9PEZI|nr:hypothetical protein LTR94_013750 [Friedmanniomyces endolithicus]KAK0787626.1 hypothetical protein LTR59_010294 [Friedmanniomyces endolithicus]KAK0789056.1 hypothetical protein LTR38_011043 [Friedmanniomyces endolithicus]KAK0842822.1 hypothetical protein LTR03_009017 [Friedmanniomyces endolithicus]KAK0857429.1 hypothetical protein LTS02_010253 [Friedmanniomyces endolithicus]
MTSPQDADLHHAISLRPHPFHQNPPPASTQNATPHSYLPVLGPESHQSPAVPTTKKPGHTSAVETMSTADEPARQRPVFQSRDSIDEGDVERGNSLPDYNDANDPYSLRHGLKTEEDLESIKANSGKKRSMVTCGIGRDPVAAYRAHKLQGFYEQQNENIERLLKPVDEHVRQAKEEREAEGLQYKIAVTGSFIANLILAALQIYAAASSKSLSLFTTMADAIFDPSYDGILQTFAYGFPQPSNLTLILCNRAVNRVDPSKYPSGKARIETAGNIAFCFLMTAVSWILIVESIRDLTSKHNSPYGTFSLPSVIAVAIAFSTKSALFLYCWALRNKYSQIRILWEDHRNDLFINGVGLLTSVGGSKLRWWIDPMGAIILSVLISFLWMRTAWSEFRLLVGVSADADFLRFVTYVSMTHSPLIVSLDTVRAWHSGPRLIVEVDVVVAPAMSVQESHDVAEALQVKLESLPDVERCYVHIDYETSHAPEHFTKKEL